MLVTLILLLLRPLAGIFLNSTTMYHDNSYSDLRQIKVTGLVTSLINLFVSLIVLVFFILFNLLKSLLYLKNVLHTKGNLFCIILGLSYIVLSNTKSLELSIQIPIFLLILSSLTLIYLVYFASSIRNKYPRFYFFSLGLFVFIALICVIVVILNLSLSIDLVQMLLSKFYYIKDFWVKIYNTRSNSTGTKPNPPASNGSNQNSPNQDNGTTPISPDQKRKRTRREASEEVREEEAVKDLTKETIRKQKANERARIRRMNNPEKSKAAYKRANDKRAIKIEEGPAEVREKYLKAKSQNTSNWRFSNPDKMKAQAARKRARDNKELAQMISDNPNHKALFDSWMTLPKEELDNIFKKREITKDIQRAFVIHKNNLNTETG